MKEQDLWQFARRATLPVNTALSLAMAACAPGAPGANRPSPSPEKNPPAQTIPEVARFTPEGKLIGKIPFKKPGRLTSGPHPDDPADDYTKVISNALDFAGEVPLKCNDTEKLRQWPVTPVAPGKVIAVGDKDKPNSADHSIILIQHPIDEKRGVASLYMHMADPWVWKDQYVTTETELGTVGCNAPANWKGEPMKVGSPHLHVSFHKYETQADGTLKREPLPAEGTILSDMVVQKDKNSGRYTGRLVKNNLVITANEGVCGPSEATIKTCGGKINYLNQKQILDTQVEIQSGNILANIDENLAYNASWLTVGLGETFFAKIPETWGWEDNANLAFNTFFERGQFTEGLMSHVTTAGEKTNQPLSYYKDQELYKLKTFMQGSGKIQISEETVAGYPAYIIKGLNKGGSTLVKDYLKNTNRVFDIDNTIVLIKVGNIVLKIALYTHPKVTQKQLPNFKKMVNSFNDYKGEGK